MKNSIVSFLAVVAVAFWASGCVGVQRGTPTAPGQVKINLKRNDYTVLTTVKSSSTVTSYGGFIVQVIDGNKIRVLGVKFFADQYCFLQPRVKLKPYWQRFKEKNVKSVLDIMELEIEGLYILPYYLYNHSSVSVEAEDRAYYKTLAATPDADVIIQKSFVRQRLGIPFLYTEEEFTLTGKAVKYNP